MEKLKAWIIVGFSSLFILIFALAFVIMIPDLFKSEIIKKDSYIAIFAFLVITTILIFGLKYGLKKLKASKPQKPINYDKVLDITFKARIEYKDYRNLILGLSFKRPVLLLYIGVSFIIIVNFFTNKDNTSIKGLTVPILLGLSLIPVLIIYQTKRIYNTSKIFHEQIIYNLTNISIKIKGESFDSEVKWAHYYKIKETKDFFILYQGKLIGNLLQKKSMNDTEINEFRLFIKSLILINE